MSQFPKADVVSILNSSGSTPRFYSVRLQKKKNRKYYPQDTEGALNIFRTLVFDYSRYGRVKSETLPPLLASPGGTIDLLRNGERIQKRIEYSKYAYDSAWWHIPLEPANKEEIETYFHNIRVWYESDDDEEHDVPFILHHPTTLLCDACRLESQKQSGFIRRKDMREPVTFRMKDMRIEFGNTSHVVKHQDTTIFEMRTTPARPSAKPNRVHGDMMLYNINATFLPEPQKHTYGNDAAARCSLCNSASTTMVRTEKVNTSNKYTLILSGPRDALPKGVHALNVQFINGVKLSNPKNISAAFDESLPMVGDGQMRDIRTVDKLRRQTADSRPAVWRASSTDKTQFMEWLVHAAEGFPIKKPRKGIVLKGMENTNIQNGRRQALHYIFYYNGDVGVRAYHKGDIVMLEQSNATITNNLSNYAARGVEYLEKLLHGRCKYCLQPFGKGGNIGKEYKRSGLCFTDYLRRYPMPSSSSESNNSSSSSSDDDGYSDDETGGYMDRWWVDKTGNIRWKHRMNTYTFLLDDDDEYHVKINKRDKRRFANSQGHRNDIILRAAIRCYEDRGETPVSVLRKDDADAPEPLLLATQNRKKAKKAHGETRCPQCGAGKAFGLPTGGLCEACFSASMVEAGWERQPDEKMTMLFSKEDHVAKFSTRGYKVGIRDPEGAVQWQKNTEKEVFDQATYTQKESFNSLRERVLAMGASAQNKFRAEMARAIQRSIKKHKLRKHSCASSTVAVKTDQWEWDGTTFVSKSDIKQADESAIDAAVDRTIRQNCTNTLQRRGFQIVDGSRWTLPECDDACRNVFTEEECTDLCAWDEDGVCRLRRDGEGKCIHACDDTTLGCKKITARDGYGEHECDGNGCSMIDALRVNKDAIADYWKIVRESTFKKFKLKDKGYACCRRNLAKEETAPENQKMRNASSLDCGDSENVRVGSSGGRPFPTWRAAHDHIRLHPWTGDVYFVDDKESLQKVPAKRLQTCMRLGGDLRPFASLEEASAAKSPQVRHYYDENQVLHHAEFRRDGAMVEPARPGIHGTSNCFAMLFGNNSDKKVAAGGAGEIDEELLKMGVKKVDDGKFKFEFPNWSNVRNTKSGGRRFKHLTETTKTKLTEQYNTLIELGARNFDDDGFTLNGERFTTTESKRKDRTYYTTAYGKALIHTNLQRRREKSAKHQNKKKAAQQGDGLHPYQRMVKKLIPDVTKGVTSVRRLLLFWRTGAGKTAAALNYLDAFFHDPRVKVLIFPTNAVADNFYRQLLLTNNRYKGYIIYKLTTPGRGDDDATVARNIKIAMRIEEGMIGSTELIATKKLLSKLDDFQERKKEWQKARFVIKQHARNRCPICRPEIDQTKDWGNKQPLPEQWSWSPTLLRGPLVCLSYEQANGAKMFTADKGRVKIPFNYKGSGNYDKRGVYQPAYSDYKHDLTLVKEGDFADQWRVNNLYSDCIIMMDEAHNLMLPNLKNLRGALRRAENSILLALSATPVLKPDDASADEFIQTFRGKHTLYVSYFNQLHPGIYPRVCVDDKRSAILGTVNVIRIPMGVESAKRYEKALKQVYGMDRDDFVSVSDFTDVLAQQVGEFVEPSPLQGGDKRQSGRRRKKNPKYYNTVNQPPVLSPVKGFGKEHVYKLLRACNGRDKIREIVNSLDERKTLILVHKSAGYTHVRNDLEELLRESRGLEPCNYRIFARIGEERSVGVCHDGASDLYFQDIHGFSLPSAFDASGDFQKLTFVGQAYGDAVSVMNMTKNAYSTTLGAPDGGVVRESFDNIMDATLHCARHIKVSNTEYILFLRGIDGWRQLTVTKDEDHAWSTGDLAKRAGKYGTWNREQKTFTLQDDPSVVIREVGESQLRHPYPGLNIDGRWSVREENVREPGSMVQVRFVQNEAAEGRCWVHANSVKCKAMLSKFNSDENHRVLKQAEYVAPLMLADASEFSEGQSFYGCERLILVSPPLSYTSYLQRIGRVLRSCDQPGQNIHIDMFVATTDSEDESVEEILASKIGELGNKYDELVKRKFLVNTKDVKWIDGNKTGSIYAKKVDPNCGEIEYEKTWQDRQQEYGIEQKQVKQDRGYLAPGWARRNKSSTPAGYPHGFYKNGRLQSVVLRVEKWMKEIRDGVDSAVFSQDAIQIRVRNMEKTFTSTPKRSAYELCAKWIAEREPEKKGGEFLAQMGYFPQSLMRSAIVQNIERMVDGSVEFTTLPDTTIRLQQTADLPPRRRRRSKKDRIQQWRQHYEKKVRKNLKKSRAAAAATTSFFAWKRPTWANLSNCSMMKPRKCGSTENTTSPTN